MLSEAEYGLDGCSGDVYLARGRDVDKPPVVALLDNDKAGGEAKTDLAAGGAYGDKLLDPSLVLQPGHDRLGGLTTENPLGILGIEDIIPFQLALAASSRYCDEFAPTVKPLTYSLTVTDALPVSPVSGGPAAKNYGMLTFLEKAIASKSGVATFHLDKVGFARAVVDVLSRPRDNEGVSDGDIAVARQNFKLLLSVISFCQRKAERAETVQKISARINRAKRDFVRTHDEQARREDVAALIEEIDSQLDLSPEAEAVRAEMRTWFGRFELDVDPRKNVADFEGLLKALNGLAYQAVRAASVP